MTGFVTAWNWLVGKKTYFASAATILMALATAAGAVPSTSGIAIVGACLAAAHICQRMAVADSATDVLGALEELRELLPGGAATVPFRKLPVGGQELIDMFSTGKPATVPFSMGGDVRAASSLPFLRDVPTPSIPPTGPEQG